MSDENDEIDYERPCYVIYKKERSSLTAEVYN
jgi:hypothetical protein